MGSRTQRILAGKTEQRSFRAAENPYSYPRFQAAGRLSCEDAADATAWLSANGLAGALETIPDSSYPSSTGAAAECEWIPA